MIKEIHWIFNDTITHFTVITSWAIFWPIGHGHHLGFVQAGVKIDFVLTSFLLGFVFYYHLKKEFKFQYNLY